jgi:biopolymer transport protein ExbD
MKYSRRRSELFSSINITPFTDIILVLLIIFMIAAPGLMNSGLDINLPGSSSSQSFKGKKLTVGMDREGVLFYNGKKASLDEVKREIALIVAENRETQILLNADAQAPHGRVIEALDSIRSTGASGVFVGAVRK